MPETAGFSEAAVQNLTAQFAALDPEKQAALVTAMGAQGIHGTQAVAGYLQEAFAAQGMNAAPVSMGLADQQAMQQNGVAAGRSTVGADDVARVVAQAENLASRMIAQGATDQQIQQAVATLPGTNLETAAIASDAAQRQLDADKFNMFSARNQVPAPQLTPATLETASAFNPLMQNALVQAHTPQRDPDEWRRLQAQIGVSAPASVSAPAFASVGSTSAALSNDISEAMLGELTAPRVPDARSPAAIARQSGNSLA